MTRSRVRLSIGGRLGLLAAGVAWVGGCAFNQPDHFHLLAAARTATLSPRTTFATQATLRVTLPSLVDRSELVLVDPDGVHILEHERWASPLADQFTAALGQDIEGRREDILVSSRQIAAPTVPLVNIDVQVVQLLLRKTSGVHLEVRWRLEDARRDTITQGRDNYDVPITGGGANALTAALDTSIGELADRLLTVLPP